MIVPANSGLGASAPAPYSAAAQAKFIAAHPYKPEVLTGQNQAQVDVWKALASQFGYYGTYLPASVYLPAYQTGGIPAAINAAVAWYKGGGAAGKPGGSSPGVPPGVVMRVTPPPSSSLPGTPLPPPVPSGLPVSSGGVASSPAALASALASGQLILNPDGTVSVAASASAGFPWWGWLLVAGGAWYAFK